MNVEELGGRGLVKRVIKWVTILTLFSVGPRQKITAKKIRQGKDGRRIAPRKDASEELGGRGPGQAGNQVGNHSDFVFSGSKTENHC